MFWWFFIQWAEVHNGQKPFTMKVCGRWSQTNVQVRPVLDYQTSNHQDANMVHRTVEHTPTIGGAERLRRWLRPRCDTALAGDAHSSANPEMFARVRPSTKSRVSLDARVYTKRCCHRWASRTPANVLARP